VPDRLEWFELSEAQMAFQYHGGPKVVSDGYERVFSWAVDSLTRPHDQTAVNLLTLECRDMAENLLKIAEEDGNALFLADVLRTLVLEAARRAAEYRKAAGA
jgi:hypothetical protein